MADPSAFPRSYTHAASDERGMALRDYFAAHALPPLVEQRGTMSVAQIAHTAYRIADAMVAESKKAPQ